MKILVLNGPNLNLLGKREPEIYGRDSLREIMSRVRALGRKMGVRVETLQSNEEGALITAIQETSGKFDGIVFNPAGYTHTSVALRDALLSCGVPCVEVHMSNILAREDFRQRSVTGAACIGQVSGFGGGSYTLALEGLVDRLKRTNKALAKKSAKKR